MRMIRRSRKKLLGIYHSHPDGSPDPSPTDMEQAFYPECAYFIIGSIESKPRLRAYRLTRALAEPIRLVCAEE